MNPPRFLIVGESSADQAAVRVLVEGILGHPVELVGENLRETRGWPHVLTMLPVLIRGAQYQTDAEYMVVVADTNGTTLQADSPAHAKEGNRLAGMRTAVENALRGLRQAHGRERVKVILGAAAPAIEAWLLSHKDQAISEASWEKILRDDPARIQGIKMDLKKRLYGHTNPTLDRETDCMVAAAREAVKHLDDLRTRFPIGFGSLYDALQALKKEAA